jgi:hypothetical protein
VASGGAKAVLRGSGGERRREGGAARIRWRAALRGAGGERRRGGGVPRGAGRKLQDAEEEAGGELRDAEEEADG